MRLGIDIRPLMDERYSGVAVYVSNLLEALFKLDKENQYILYYNSGRKVKDRLPKFDYPNVTCIHTSFPNKFFNYVLQKIFNYPKIDKVIGGVDIFFSPHINFTSLSDDCEKVITIHDLSFLRYPEFFNKRKNFWHRSLALQSLAKNFSRFVTVSDNTRRDLVDLLGINLDDISVIYPGKNSSLKVYEKDDPYLKGVKEKYNLPDNFILYLGTIEPRKNVLGLIQAFEYLRNSGLVNFKLVLVGQLGWKYKKIIRAVRKSAFRSDIIFLDYIDEADKAGVYNLAKVFVYPSFYEGFGFPPLEAAACGTPVVASFSSSLPEVMAEAAILVDPDDSKSLYKAIENLLLDPELYTIYRNKGLDRANIFSWEKTAQEYLRLFNELNNR